MSLNKRYYIEFTGAHGAGKTHTYHKIAKQQLLKPYTAVYPGQVQRPRFHFLINCPLLAIKNIKHIIFVVGFFKRYAEITLIKGDLNGILKAYKLSKSTMRNIRQNLFFAFIYNTLGVPIAAGILYPYFGILLSPIIAAAAMSFSSVSVILNALRLKNIKLK